MDEYRDRWIECTDEEIRICGYYFPWGTKRIPYARVRGVERVTVRPLHGSGSIWGTANPRYWASLDPQRRAKSAGLILDLGGFIRPFITPDDPGAVENIIRGHAHLGPASGTESSGPVI